MTDERLFDVGLQPERTLLAWRRTCLSFAVASAAAARASFEIFGLLSVIVGVVGVGLAVATYIAASAGYRRAHVALHARNSSGTHGVPIVLATAAVLAIGAGCAIFLAARALA